MTNLVLRLKPLPTWLLSLCLSAPGVAGLLALTSSSQERKRTIRIVAASVLGLSILGLTILLFGGVSWRKVTLSVLCWNGLVGALLAIFVGRAPSSEKFEASHETPEHTGTFRSAITGLFVGLGFSLALGPGLAMICQALLSWLLDGITPNTMGELETVGVTALLIVSFTILGALVGLLSGRKGERPRLADVGCITALLGLSVGVHYLLLGILILAPLWFFTPVSQAATQNQATFSALMPFAIIPLALPTYLFLAPGRTWPTLGARLLVSAWLVSMFYFNLVIIFGLYTHLAFGLGKALEKDAQLERATMYYQRALDWSRSPELDAYLQYRLALIHRKKGENDQAKAGFSRVLAQHAAVPELVERASAFLDGLQELPDEQRVVIPGIETRTAFRGSYCAPNSLALVMNFWNYPVSAKEMGAAIASTSYGTRSLDEVWFARQAGFEVKIFSHRDLEDLYRILDAGFPVLCYVPGHVLAVFGYDRALGSLITYDTADLDLWKETSIDDFLPEWQALNCTLSLVAPSSAPWEDLPFDSLESQETLSLASLQYLLSRRRQNGFFSWLDLRYVLQLNPDHLEARLRLLEEDPSFAEETRNDGSFELALVLAENRKVGDQVDLYFTHRIASLTASFMGPEKALELMTKSSESGIPPELSELAGELYMELNNYEQAARQFRLDTSNLDLINAYRLGKALQILGSPEQAIDTWVELLACGNCDTYDCQNPEDHDFAARRAAEEIVLAARQGAQLDDRAVDALNYVSTWTYTLDPEWDLLLRTRTLQRAEAVKGGAKSELQAKALRISGRIALWLGLDDARLDDALRP